MMDVSPRETATLVGHAEAEADILHAIQSGRMHHAWLITGPQGIGKATLAYRIARYLLANPEGEAAAMADAGPSLFGDLPATPPTSLDVPEDHPVFRQVAAGAHPDLMVVEKGVTKEGRQRTEIVVEDVRAVVDFYSKTSAAGGWRVTIIDSVDELNRSAANALLKVLEEPPARAVLLLVAHMPGRVLPTLRSRCRRLALRPLPPADFEELIAAKAPDLGAEERRLTAALADGSPGVAFKLISGDGLALYHQAVDLLTSLPSLDPRTALALADEMAGRGNEEKFRLFGDILGGLLGRAACVAGGGMPGLSIPGEEETLRRLANVADFPTWSELWERCASLIAKAEGLTLDRKQVTLTLLSDLERATRP